MLRLNLATDYGLRILLFLAHAPDDTPSTGEIAHFYRISPDHVRKVARQLAQHHFVTTVRGRSGGLRLARPPGSISVGEVVELLEGPTGLLECVLHDGVCVVQPQCRLRHVLADAGARLIADLRRVMLSELVADGGELVRLDPAPTIPIARP